MKKDLPRYNNLSLDDTITDSLSELIQKDGCISLKEASKYLGVSKKTLMFHAEALQESKIIKIQNRLSGYSLEMVNYKRNKAFDSPKMKGLAVAGMFMLMLAGIGFSAWYIGIQDDATISITSDSNGVLYATTYFNDISVDATNQSYEISDSKDFFNSNGELSLRFNGVVSVVDVDSDACNNTADFELTAFTVDNNIVNENDYVNLSSGSHTMSYNATVKRASCPQNVSIIMGLAEI